MKRLILIFLIPALVLAGALIWVKRSTDDDAAARLLQIFQQFDENHQGVLSKEQQAKAIVSLQKTHGVQWAEQVGKMLERARNEDGTVTEANWKKLVAEFGKAPATKE
jgi:uncharacterized membrane protein